MIIMIIIIIIIIIIMIIIIIIIIIIVVMIIMIILFQLTLVIEIEEKKTLRNELGTNNQGTPYVTFLFRGKQNVREGGRVFQPFLFPPL